MNTSDNNIVTNIRAKDPIDVLIFEKGLRIKKIIVDKELDLLAIILNNGKILESRISDYQKLKNAEESQLQNWQLIDQGVGVTWEELDEDLSVKGFIKTAAINEMLEHLAASGNNKKSA